MVARRARTRRGTAWRPRRAAAPRAAQRSQPARRARIIVPPRGDAQPPRGDAQPPRGDAQPPRGDAQPWVRPLDLTPFAERAPLKNALCLQPVSDGEHVLVGSTLRLFALDAFSGEIRWEA